MALKRGEFRWLKVATAVAVCLPFSSLTAMPQNLSDSTGKPVTNELDISSLPSILTQYEYQNQHSAAQTTVSHTETPAFLQSIAAMDRIEAHTSNAEGKKAPALLATSDSAQATIKTAEAQVLTGSSTVTNTQVAAPAKGKEASLFASRTEGRVATPVESSTDVKSLEPPKAVMKTTQPPALVERRADKTVGKKPASAKVKAVEPEHEENNQAALRKNYDFFPPVQQYYQPDPAYKNVRWHGEINGESGKRAISGMSGEALNGHSTSPSRNFLKKMVSLALAHSPEIRASEADVLAAGYYVDQAKGQRWPQVQVGVAAPLGTQGGNDSTNRNNSKLSDTSGSVSITTPIYDWGKISNQVDSAEEGVSAAVNSQHATKEQLAYSTVSELMNLSRFMESRVVAQAYVERMKQLADMLSQITEADRGRASEFTQAKAKYLSARASLDNIEHELSTSRIKLVRLLGVEPKLPANLSWQDSMVSASTALATLDKNPNLLKLKSQVKAAEYEADSIRSANLPQLNWVVSKSTAKNTNGDETGWYTGVNVQWNAFSGGSQKAAQMAARAKANSAQQQYEVAYRDLEYQINNMIQTRDSSFLRADDFDRLSVETNQVRQMFYDQWYNLGKRTLLDVLTAENDHFNNQLSAINNRYDGYISNINVIASSAMLLGWVGK